MNNPHELPAPADIEERVKAFALDLAWGVRNERWEDGFPVTSFGEMRTWLPPQSPISFITLFSQFLKDKWGNQPPDSDQMESHGYLKSDSPDFYSSFQRIYCLTDKAFELLNPPKPLNVFISYKHTESGAFASFIAAKLASTELQISVFTDRELKPGVVWENQLERKIRECDVFISIFGPTTLDSPVIQREINWALESGCDIIPVWHNEYEREDRYPEELRGRQHITVHAESMEMYEYALQKLLTSLKDLSSAAAG